LVDKKKNVDSGTDRQTDSKRESMTLQKSWLVCECIENFKEKVTKEQFRQDLLSVTSMQSVNLDESKRPSFKQVNESFRKLAVD